MATGILPITNISLPSDEWAVRDFRVHPSCYEQSTSFDFAMVHLPTRASFLVRNGGVGNANDFDWLVLGSDFDAAKAAWAKFVEDCASFAPDEDAVITLFVDEMTRQEDFDAIKNGTVVRTADGEFKIVFGSLNSSSDEDVYWNRKTKNWSPIG